MDLPTVELIDQSFYWVKPAYGDNADRWTVARWSAGCFWAGRQEVTPSVISGPIPSPASGDLGSALTHEGRMTEPLKPCPFCGEAPYIRKGVNPYGHCQTDGRHANRAQTVALDDPKQVAAWNRRAALEQGS